MFVFPPGGRSTGQSITCRLFGQSVKDSICNVVVPYFSFKHTTGICEIRAFGIKVKCCFKTFKKPVSVWDVFNRESAITGQTEQLRIHGAGGSGEGCMYVPEVQLSQDHRTAQPGHKLWRSSHPTHAGVLRLALCALT